MAKGAPKIIKTKSDVARFVESARERLKVNGTDFGEMFGRTKAAVSGWEGGKSEPAYDQLRLMSEMSGVPLPGFEKDGTLPGRTPVVGEARLGDEGFFEENPYPNGSDGWVKYPGANGTYALRCRGDSMRPRIKPGEFVVIEPRTQVVDGDEVAVQTVDGRRMIKILNRRRGGVVELTSINDDHKPITLDDDEIQHMHSVAAILKASMYYPDS